MVDIMMLRIARDHTDDQIELHRAALDKVTNVASRRSAASSGTLTVLPGRKFPILEAHELCLG
jgi:hypothetical protein